LRPPSCCHARADLPEQQPGEGARNGRRGRAEQKKDGIVRAHNVVELKSQDPRDGLCVEKQIQPATRGASGKQRMVPLINGADRALAWYVEDVWSQFGADHSLPGAPLFPSERQPGDGPGVRVSTDGPRRALADAVMTTVAVFLPIGFVGGVTGRLFTP
jgi:hypothetical protein